MTYNKKLAFVSSRNQVQYLLNRTDLRRWEKTILKILITGMNVLVKE